ncbi:MAG: lasso peptide biosynthesis PqqD family chaperone [Bacteroidales bacterium]|nr:lasso peptide biosynthesis PqqD family chaperone [Bacteroidales bacterium]
MSQKSAFGDQLIQRQPEMVFSRIDEEVVMMSIETGEYYGLNPVATRIWELLENPLTFDTLIDALLQEFDIDRDTCCEEVESFLKKLQEKRLIIVI